MKNIENLPNTKDAKIGEVMASMRYTSKEFRESADNFPYLFNGYEWNKIVAMLRQAAEMREVIDKLV